MTLSVNILYKPLELFQGMTIDDTELRVEKSVRRRPVENHVDGGSAGDESGEEE